MTILTPVLPLEKTILSKLIEEEREYLNYFLDHIDLASAETIVNTLLNCQGAVFFMGVGKSGFIARKLAATMASLGLKAFFLSPLDTLHGDLGGVSENDLVFLLSKSGESDELLQVLPFLRNKGATLIALVTNQNSRLAKTCDLVMCLPLKRELCPFDMAPTTSTETQLIFGNLLAVAYMVEKNISVETFVTNHPGGRIGRRMSLRVKDLMISDKGLPLCKETDQLQDVLIELSAKRCGCLLVVDEQMHLLGIFTDGDLRRALQNNLEGVLKKTLSELMTKTPRTILPQTLALKAMQEMEAHPNSPIMVLPVVDSEFILQGLIKMHDILQSGL